jgi:hypothetical protein
VAVAAAAVAVLFLPVTGVEPVRTPVSPPRSVEGQSLDREDGAGQILTLASFGRTGPEPSEHLRLMAIDGNRDGTLVLFNHDAHVEREGGDTSCAVCHHLNMPLDRNTSCFECHRDMYGPTSLFDHASHVDKLDGNQSCSECHTDYSAVKDYETATACTECHESPAESTCIVEAPDPRWRDAVSYVDAMHGLCVSCHRRKIEESPERYSIVLDRCDKCHDADLALDLRFMSPHRGKTDTVVASRVANK